DQNDLDLKIQDQVIHLTFLLVFQRGSRCLVLITVGLGLICVLLLVFIILQHITITAERDRIKSYKNTAEEFNQTINSLQDNHTDLTIKKSQLQDNFNSLSQKNLELESQVRSLSDQLKKESKRGQICCFWSSSLLMHVYSFLKCLCKNLCGLDGFFLSNEFKSWSDSRQYCRDHGADLVIINSGEKQVSFLWIGLSDRQQEGNMKWVDNSPLKQGFWLKGEPNDQGGDEDCIELMPSNPVLNNWNDLSCSEKRKGICQK
uniref:C-type lectin domain-containing protein n=1 Tax=Sinocyclocheilus grahami TaxID=75366 RepID=A0A672LGG0_SINGR